MKDFMTAAEVARRFDVTARTVVRWIEEGRLPGASKLNPAISNSPFIIPVASVESLAEEQSQENGKTPIEQDD